MQAFDLTFVTMIIALVLPWLLGLAWLGWLRGSRALRLGYGYLLGMLVTVGGIYLIDYLGIALSFMTVATPLLLLCGLGFWLFRRHPHAPDDGLSSWHQLTGWQQALFCLLLGALAVRLGSLAAEVALRPLFAWDAWTTWTVRARVWFEHRQLTPFVDSGSWLADPSGAHHTIEAWRYPLTVSLIQLWTALGQDQWNESVNNLPWVLCAAALGFGFYGQARRWGANPLLSLLFTYLLLSLPILNTHVALAGYADLWLAAVYSLAAIALLAWLRDGDRQQLLLALLLALLCPLIKREGLIWLLTLAPVLLFAPLPGMRWLRLAVLASIAALGVLLWQGGYEGEVPGLGPVALTLDRIELPYLGSFALMIEGSWGPFIENFLVLSSWHLLWYATILALLLFARVIVSDRLLLAGLILLLTDFALLFGLFFFTNARLWAEQFTSINRLFLHMAPLLMFYLLMLAQHALARRSTVRDTAPAAALQPA